ncbi:hypothetical protein DRO97_01345 [Archaeoglobales archaeon]|nr:MAG: hypothetical protein DRO97_01345 [Archaeoglobales archaeon]
MLICFQCGRINCKELPVNGRCPQFRPADWIRYLSHGDLAVWGRGGLRRKRQINIGRLRK